MPSIVPSYLYTFFALMLVGTILTGAFSSFILYLKNVPKEIQLRNIVDYVADKCLELINCASTSNEAVLRVFLEIPTSVNHEYYWLRLRMDSGSVIVEAGLGEAPAEALYKVHLSGSVSASGEIVSWYGKAMLVCRRTASGTVLNLGYLEE